METRGKSSKKPLTEEELDITREQVHKQQERLHKESEAFERMQEEFRREREEFYKEHEQIRQAQSITAKSKEMEELNRHLQQQLEILQKEIEAQKIQPTTSLPRDKAVEEFQERLDLMRQEMDLLKNHVQEDSINTVDITSRAEKREDSIPGISLREIVDTIPSFDGYNISLQRFINACRRAKNLLPRSMEEHLTTLLINKLHGRAYIAIEDEVCKNVTDLIDLLTSTFGVNKTTDQYRGELSTIYMKPEEHILDYINRTKELRSAVIDSSRRDRNAEHLSRDIDDLTIRAFCDGLPRTYKLEMKPQEYYTPTEAYAAARKISKDLEVERQRYGRRFSEDKPPLPQSARYGKRPDTQYNQPSGYTNDRNRYSSEVRHESRRNAENNVSILPRSPKFCSYCRRTGHIIEECFKKQRNEKSHASGNEKSPARRDAPRTDYTKSRPVQITTAKKDEEKPSTSRQN